MAKSTPQPPLPWEPQSSQLPAPALAPQPLVPPPAPPLPPQQFAAQQRPFAQPHPAPPAPPMPPGQTPVQSPPAAPTQRVAWPPPPAPPAPPSPVASPAQPAPVRPATAPRPPAPLPPPPLPSAALAAPAAAQLPSTPLQPPTPQAAVPPSTPGASEQVPAPAADEEFEATVVVARGKAATAWRLIDIDGTVFVLHQANVLGRRPHGTNAPTGAQLIALSDPEKVLSRTHALLEVDAAGLWITDLDSTNGTDILSADTDVTECEPAVRTAIPAGASVSFGGREVSFLAPGDTQHRRDGVDDATRDRDRNAERGTT